MVWCDLSWSIDRHITWFTYQNRFCHSWVVTACCFRSLFTVGLSSCHLSSNCTPGRLEFKSKVDIFSTFSFNQRMISWQEHSISFENISHAAISQAHIIPQVAQARNISIGEHRRASASIGEHRRASALLRNAQNIRICMGKKPIVSVTYENEWISIKNSLPYLKCVLRLSCVVHGPIYCRFIGFLCKQFSLYIKVYQGWALQWSGSTDPPKKNGQKFAPAAPITSKFRLGNTR